MGLSSGALFLSNSPLRERALCTEDPAVRVEALIYVELQRSGG